MVWAFAHSGGATVELPHGQGGPGDGQRVDRVAGPGGEHRRAGGRRRKQQPLLPRTGDRRRLPARQQHPRPPGEVAVAPASPPDAMTADVTGSGADAVQAEPDGWADGWSGAYAYHPNGHIAVSPALARTSAMPAPSRTSWPDTGRLSRCQPPPGE